MKYPLVEPPNQKGSGGRVLDCHRSLLPTLTCPSGVYHLRASQGWEEGFRREAVSCKQRSLRQIFVLLAYFSHMLKKKA